MIEEVIKGILQGLMAICICIAIAELVALGHKRWKEFREERVKKLVDHLRGGI